MTRRLAHGEVVVRQRATTSTDAYGNVQRSWTAADELTIDCCGLAPLVEDEIQTDGRDAVPSTWTLYIPDRHVDVKADDRIRTGYGVFDVDGEPGLWRSPYTGREGMTCKLRVVEG